MQGSPLHRDQSPSGRVRYIMANYNDVVVTEINVPNNQFEASFIGGVINNPYVASSIKDKLLKLSSESFSNIVLGKIWSLILELIKKDIEPDLTVVGNTINNDPITYPIEVFHAFMNAVSHTPGVNASVLEYYIKQISNSYERRKLASKVALISRDIATPSTDLKLVCETAQKVFNDVQVNDGDEEYTLPAVEVGVKVIQGVHDFLSGNGKPSGVKSGFTQLDECIRGFAPASLNLIAARPGVGKTSFALNIIENVALNMNEDKPVIFFSLEMTKEDIMKRMLCTFGAVSLSQLESGMVTNQSWMNITHLLNQLCPTEESIRHQDSGSEAQELIREPGNRLYICDRRDISASGIWSEARRIAKRHAGIGLIVVDYVQIIKPENSKTENVNQQIKDINRVLLCMAKEFQCPLIVLSQLNRDIERRSNKRPTNADLRDSGSLEADASLIMFISKEEQSRAAKATASQDMALIEDVTLSITKNRNGPSDQQIAMTFNGAHYRFAEIGSRH